MNGSAPERMRSILGWIVGILAAGLLLRITSHVVIPLVFAIFFSILFAPVANYLQARRWPAALATAACTVGLILLLAGLSGLVVVSIASVAAKSQVYADKAGQLLRDVRAGLESVLPVEGHVDWIEQLGGAPDPAAVLKNVSNVGLVLGAIALILVYFTFLVHFREVVHRRALAALPPRPPGKQGRSEILSRVQATLRRYLWLKVLISIATAAAIGAVAALLGLDFVPAWVLLAFGLNFIPSVGPMLAVAPPVAVAFLQSGFAFGAVVAGSMAAIHFLSGNIIEPGLLGSRLRINFLVILLSLFLWNLIWGFAGMVLAVPLVAAAKVFVDEYGYPWTLRLALSPMADSQLSSEIRQDPELASGKSEPARPVR